MKTIKIIFLTLIFLATIPIKWCCDISVRILSFAQEKLADFAYYWALEFSKRKQKEQ
jgi:hypothetical protein